MKRSKHVLGGLLALGLLAAGTSQAAVQTFTDERDRGPSLPPAIISATLTDPYADTKPIQHEGYADFSYWYTAGPNWRDSTAVIDDGFTASLRFNIDSTDLTHRAISVQTGFMIDRPVDITIPTVGRIDTTLRVLDSSANVVATYNVSDLASDRFTVGYSHVVEVPSVVGKHFTVEAQFHIAQQGQYLLFGEELPINDRYLFSGFSVTTTPVPEPGAVAMVLGGLACVGFLRPRRRKKRLIAGLTLAAGLMGAAQAQDAVIASATLDITGFRYRLVDLDLGDGIAPSVVFTDALKTQAGARESGPAGTVSQIYDGLFPAPFTLSTPSTLAQAVRTEDGFTVRAEVRASDLGNAATWPTQPFVFLSQRSANAGAASVSGTGLILSPHTQLIIEGQLTPSLSLDMSSLSTHPLIQDPAGAIQGLHGRGIVYLAYGAFDEGGTQMSEGSAHAALEQDAWRGATGSVSSDIAMPAAFSFGLTNDSATSMNGQINWSAVVYADVAGAVPEPETVALSAAGLLVLGSRSLRRRRQG